MTQYLKPFEPIVGGTIKKSNSTSATSAAVLPETADVVALYNGDTAAVAFFRCQKYSKADFSSGSLPTCTAVADVDVPVPPGQMIRIAVPLGPKVYSIVASAATGSTWIVPGNGN